MTIKREASTAMHKRQKPTAEVIIILKELLLIWVC
jgi:hypothetical protein